LRAIEREVALSISLDRNAVLQIDKRKNAAANADLKRSGAFLTEALGPLEDHDLGGLRPQDDLSAALDNVRRAEADLQFGLPGMLVVSFVKAALTKEKVAMKILAHVPTGPTVGGAALHACIYYLGPSSTGGANIGLNVTGPPGAGSATVTGPAPSETQTKSFTLGSSGTAAMSFMAGYGALGIIVRETTSGGQTETDGFTDMISTSTPTATTCD
jgi:hypothetical protein